MGVNEKDSNVDKSNVKEKSSVSLKKNRENEKEKRKDDGKAKDTDNLGTKEDEETRVRTRQEIELNEKYHLRKEQKEKEQKKKGDKGRDSGTDNPSQALFVEEVGLPLAGNRQEQNGNAQNPQTVLEKGSEQDAQKEKDFFDPSNRLISSIKETVPVSTKEDTMTEADREKKKRG